MNSASIVKPRLACYGLVRDPQGRPKIDGNPHDLPQQIKDLLTPEDWDYLETKNGYPC